MNILKIDMKPDKKHPTAVPSYRYKAYRTRENEIEIVRKTGQNQLEKIVFTIHPASQSYIDEHGKATPLTTDTLIRFFNEYTGVFIETGASWFPRIYTSEEKLRALMNVLNDKIYMHLVENGFACIDRRRGHCLETFDCWPLICAEVQNQTNSI